MARLDGHAGRLAVQSGGARPGQSGQKLYTNRAPHAAARKHPTSFAHSRSSDEKTRCARFQLKYPAIGVGSLTDSAMTSANASTLITLSA